MTGVQTCALPISLPFEADLHKTQMQKPSNYRNWTKTHYSKLKNKKWVSVKLDKLTEDGCLSGIVEAMAFWSALIFLCVGWSDVEFDFSFRLIGKIRLVSDDFLCGLIGFFFGFWWFYVWVDRYVWLDLIFVWFLMMVVMVAGWW